MYNLGGTFKCNLSKMTLCAYMIFHEPLADTVVHGY